MFLVSREPLLHTWEFCKVLMTDPYQTNTIFPLCSPQLHYHLQKKQASYIILRRQLVVGGKKEKRVATNEMRKKKIPAGWTAIDETSRSWVSSFFISFCFNKSYTRTFFFVATKKIERVGWKTDDTGRPWSLKGSRWVSLLESWCMRIALDSRD